MRTRSKGPSAGFGWLTRGIDVAYRHPKPLLGGAGLLMVASLIPTLVTLPLQLQAAQPGAQPDPATFGAMMVLSLLLSLLLMPLYAGYLQVVDAAERGLPARARDIFKPYAQGQALRLIGFALLLTVIYVGLLVLLMLAAGGGVAGWYMQTLAAQANHLPPPGLPGGFAVALALLGVLGLFMTGFYAISLGQVALGERGVFAALGDGAVGALKNVLPLLVFVLSLLLVWVVAAIVLVLVTLVLLLVGKLVGTWLMLVLYIPLSMATLLIIYAVMFGVIYHLWRDVCGGATPPDIATAAA